MCELSRAQIAGMFDNYCVHLNEAVCKQPFVRTKEGDKVELRYDDSRRYHEKKPLKNLGFEIVYEDEHVIVVNKPPQILTVPTPYREKNTLIQKVSTYLSHGGNKREAFVCHRLDRGVSGLLVFGKSLSMSMKIRDQFELRKPQREYVAIVRGGLKSPEGTFRSYLATDANLNRFSTDASEEGQLAITHYRVITPLDDATLVQIWLETGRRNQIRVHFAEAQHPVLGDPRYESDNAVHPKWHAKRIALHARSLGFQHPVTEKGFRFESDLPSEFADFIRATSRRDRQRR